MALAQLVHEISARQRSCVHHLGQPFMHFNATLQQSSILWCCASLLSELASSCIPQNDCGLLGLVREYCGAARPQTRKRKLLTPKRRPSPAGQELQPEHLLAHV